MSHHASYKPRYTRGGLTGNVPSTKIQDLYLPTAAWARIEELARASGVRPNAYLREIIECFLEEKRGNKPYCRPVEDYEDRSLEEENVTL